MSTNLCLSCHSNPSSLILPSSSLKICSLCLSSHIHKKVAKALNIPSNPIIPPGSSVAIASSGGKDSAVLASVILFLNSKYNLNYKLSLVAIDEGIAGYRDAALVALNHHANHLNLPLFITPFSSLFNTSMDNIVASIGHSNNCTFCGVLRRQALDKASSSINAQFILTGHNADDIAETVLMNFLRGDFARLQRCTKITTATNPSIPRIKPLKYTYEKEIVLYAYFNKITYFSTECSYSPFAYRGFARSFIKDLESIRPSSILDIIHAAESFQHSNSSPNNPSNLPSSSIGECHRCGYMSNNSLCKACLLLEGLNKGQPKLGIGKTEKIRKLINSSNQDSHQDSQKDPNQVSQKNQHSSSKKKSSQPISLDW